jgi:lysozyme
MYTVKHPLIEFTRSFEDFRAVPTPNARGVLFVGYGHHVGKGEIFTALTDVSARQLLEMDLARTSEEIQRMIKVSLTQGQHDALTDLAFSVGPGVFKYSRVLENLNLGEYKRAANQFGYLVYDGKDRSARLIRRRTAEKSLFNG